MGPGPGGTQWEPVNRIRKSMIQISASTSERIDRYANQNRNLMHRNQNVADRSKLESESNRNQNGSKSCVHCALYNVQCTL